MNLGKKILIMMAYVFLILVTFITLFPIIYAVLSSFKSNQEIMTTGINLIPKKFIFDNYKQAWELADFKRYTWNSIYMSFFIVVGTILTSTAAGYAFQRGNFPYKSLLFKIFTATMFISMGSITLYPLLDVAKFLHINTSLWGVILIKVLGLQITNIFLVKGFIATIPYEIDESAKIDGCSFIKIFIFIVSPLLKPMIAVVGLLTFQAAWNDYLLPMVFTLGNPKQAPLVVGVVALKSTGAAASSWNLMMAGTMISIVPILTVYLFLNRYFIKGLTTGSVKG